MDFFTEDYLAHHGVQGQKWGVRRYQNPDGSLTPRGKKRVAKLHAKIDEKYDKATKKARKVRSRAALSENVAETLSDKGYKKVDPTIWKYDQKGVRYDGKPYTKRDKKFLKQESKENLKAYHDLIATKAKINYEQKLRDIRKSEVDDGFNYWERARNRDIAIGVLLNTYAGVGLGVYDAYKYTPGRDDRQMARKELNDEREWLDNQMRRVKTGGRS